MYAKNLKWNSVAGTHLHKAVQPFENGYSLVLFVTTQYPDVYELSIVFDGETVDTEELIGIECITDEYDELVIRDLDVDTVEEIAQLVAML